jgi:hypothetical protein
MERKTELMGVILKFAFIDIREIAYEKIVDGIVIEAVEHEFCAEFLMDLFKGIQIKVPEGAPGSRSGNVRKKENTVVNVKVIAFEGVFIPDESYGVSFLTIFAYGPDSYFVEFIPEINSNLEALSAPDDRKFPAVNENSCRRVSQPFQLEKEAVFHLPAMGRIENGSISAICDFKHKKS